MTNHIELTLTTRQAILATFILGFIIGGTGIGTLQQLDTPTGAITGDSQGNTPADTNNNPSPSNTDDTTTKIDMSKISLKNEPVLGQKNAPVTMVVYEDFECPFCKRFEEGAVPQIVSNFVESGKVKLVWKDFPLTRIHPWAEPAAAAMECVYRKGGDDAFWAVKTKVFDNQNAISTSNVESKIKQWAAEEGVSKSAVQRCLDNGNPMQEVNEDKQEGSSLGVSGTPTAFVNGVKLVGAQPYSRFKTVINSALNGGSGSGTQSVDKTITVSGTEYSFSPSTITVTKGQTVRVTFTNTGRIPHNLRIPSLGVGSRTIRAGQTDSFTFTAPESGTFPIKFVCSLPGHAQNGMKGTLTTQ